MVRLAAEAGVDVLCEKPLGVERTDMEEMIAACRSQGVQLMTAMCNRYIHSFREAMQAVKEGQIGRLVAVFASNKGTMPGGWFTEKELSGGGCVIDHTVHVADLMNHMLDAQPLEVYAQSGNRLFEMNVEDCAFHDALSCGRTGNAGCQLVPHGLFSVREGFNATFIGSRGTIYVDYFAEHIASTRLGSASTVTMARTRIR